MDGRFVPNITIGPAVIASLRKITDIPFDVHLMIENPERYIEDFAAAGSDMITVHVEAANHLHRTIGLIKELGIKAGVALNPATPIALTEQIMEDLDILLVMTVNPGFGGQKFIDKMLSKIEKARDLIKTISPDVILEVDGGVTLDNIRGIADAGADAFVAGASVFKSADYRQAIGKMKEIISCTRP